MALERWVAHKEAGRRQQGRVGAEAGRPRLPAALTMKGNGWRMRKLRPASRRVKILIADDEEIVRLGLRQAIIRELGGAHVSEAVNEKELLKKIREEEWDLALLDISLAGGSGLDALTEVRKKRPAVPVLVLSMFPEREYALRALKAGAAGYLTRRSLGRELVAAIKTVLSGGRYITPTQAELLAAGLDDDGTKLPHEKLSDREFEIMRLIATAKSVKDIASELALGEKTVFTHRARLLEKMGLKNDVEVARYALRQHLVE